MGWPFRARLGHRPDYSITSSANCRRCKGTSRLLALDGKGGCWSACGNKPREENMYRLRIAALAVALACGAPAPAQNIVDEWSSVKPPAPPELKPVTLDPKTTALLAMDMIKQFC